MAAVISIELAPGTVTHGDWCEPCALPSVSTVTIYQLAYSGVRRLATVTYCQECGEWERETQ